MRNVAIALAVGLLIGGGLAWTLKPAPPKPEVRAVTKTNIEYRDRIVRDESSNTLQVLPPKTVTRTITRYVAAEAGECKVAEVVSEREETGPGGTVATSTQAKMTKDSSANLQQIGQQVETYDESPRFTLGLGAAASPLADERKLAPSLNLGWRAYKNYTLRVAADVPPSDVREARVALWLEVPL